MKALLQFLILPQHVTEFEQRYLQRVNRVALLFFALHVPVFAAVAWANGTGAWLATALTSAAVLGPLVAWKTIDSPRAVSIVHGVTAMFMGGLLVHFGQGPMQIEMHFYFFALVAMCAVFGNPLVIVAATLTVALHHLLVWLVLPRSVFNYEAAWWVVGVHATFVVLEATATCFIARSFFDNVIGLEKIVEARTAALDAKNRDMRLLLDNVQQGFLTIDRDGTLALERSAAVDAWFGAPMAGTTLFQHLERIDLDFARRSAFAWEEVKSDVLPLELTIDQMPRHLTVGSTHLCVEYRPIGSVGATPERFLVIVTDVTTELAREKSESERREAMAVFERVLTDRAGCESFFEEGTQIVEVLSNHRADDATTRRLLHTLKGNAALYGLSGVATMCHTLEDQIAETGAMPAPEAYRPLVDRWSRLTGDIERLLGRHARTLEIDDAQYEALLAAVLGGASQEALLRSVRHLRLEPTQKRLRHFGEQARRIAERLDKEIDVRIVDQDVRLNARDWSPFWGTFIHAVRNAVDHGIEPIEERRSAGKPTRGNLTLRTVEHADRLVIEIEDDGKGISWESVADRARAVGLPATSAEDLQRALFSDGVSTAESISDISGRGIGMGALLHGVRTRGGAIEVHSERGKGTRLRMTFPTARAAIPMNDQAAE